MAQDFRPPVFGRSLRVSPAAPALAETDAGDKLVLVRCQGCRSPVGRYAAGSRGELRCRRCGRQTTVQVG